MRRKRVHRPTTDRAIYPRLLPVLPDIDFDLVQIERRKIKKMKKKNGTFPRQLPSIFTFLSNLDGDITYDKGDELLL